MNRTNFEQLVEKKLSECQRVLGLKAANYAHSAVTKDRLNNFKTAGKLQGCSPETALGGMLSKHLVAIFDLIKMIERDEPIILAEWDEKITDSINYLLLLWALVCERKQGTPYFIVDPTLVDTEELKDLSPGEPIRTMKSKGMEPLFSSSAQQDEITRMREKGTVE